MERSETLYLQEEIKLSRKEKEKIYDALYKIQKKHRLGGYKEPKQLTKDKLKGKSHLYIQFNLEGEWSNFQIGLFLVEIDEERNELRGMRIFRNAVRGDWFSKITLYLDNYDMKWRAFG